MVDPLSTAIGSSVAKSAVGKVAGDLYDAAKKELGASIEEWKNRRYVNNLYKNIQAVQKVKTLWQVDKEIKLGTFYYPPRVVIADEPRLVDQIDALPDRKNYVIQGTIGQGKSTFLRFLCVRQLMRSDRIPIFLELRRLEPNQSFSDFLRTGLDALGFPPVTDALLDLYCRSGSIVLLLDGFDELDPSHVGRVVSSLETLTQRYASLQVIVTSRPDSGIERSAQFRVLRMAPLRPEDHEPFLEKIVTDEKKRSQLLAAIKKSPSQITSLLTTPLMLTLLVLVYRAEQKIPTELSEFYEALFVTLISRHDKAKPGFTRKRFSRLSDRKLQQSFEAFAFLTRQSSLSVLSDDQFDEIATKAVHYVDTTCEPHEFRDDVTKVACLMMQEAQKYYFVHKSVQEFYAASFVKHGQDALANVFYAKCVELLWTRWRQELSFLSQIDQYRWAKHFSVPSLLLAFGRVGISGDGPWSPPTDQAILDLLDSIEVWNSGKDTNVGITFGHMDNMVLYDVQVAAISEIFDVFGDKVSEFPIQKATLDKGRYILSFRKLREGADEKRLMKLIDLIRKQLQRRHMQLDVLRRMMATEESKGGLMDLI